MSQSTLTDTQLKLLSQASQRDDLLIHLPDALKGGAVKSVVAKLLAHHLVVETAVGRGDPSWRRDEHEQPIGLKLTRGGLPALGLDPEEGGDGATCALTGAAANGEHAPARAPVFRDGSKRALVVALLGRGQGASLDELVQATGWLPHTTRAALTGLRQRGFVLTRDKAEDGRSV
jgi:hypothetical protein